LSFHDCFFISFLDKITSFDLNFKTMQRIIIFICLILSTFVLKAQFSVGLRQGYGSHGIYFVPDLEKYQVPYYLSNTGLVIIYNNVNNAGLQVEFNYARKGWMETDTTQKTREYYMQKGDTLTSNPYFKQNINYLEIPILSHWEMGYGKVRPVIFAGPYLAFKLSESKDSANFSHLWNENNKYNQYEQEIRDFGYGIKLGIGLRYNITNRLGIYIDGRYDLQIAGSRDIFVDRPNNIAASRLTELGATFGIIWHIIPQPKKEVKEGYQPKEDLFTE